MREESLKKAKAELMLNLFLLLDENNYENDIKKLKRK